MAPGEKTTANGRWRPGQRLIRATVGLAIVIAAISIWRPWRAEDDGGIQATREQPIFQTPNRNAAPNVRYVGDEACAACHAAQAESFRLHPMGRSLARAADAASLERLEPEAGNPFEHTAGGETYRYQVELRGGRMFHTETRVDHAGNTLFESEQPVEFAVGSGSHGRSYLVNRDGYLFMSPITWYPQKQTWALSPGFEVRNQHFTRPILTECLFCHANFADHVPDTINRYQPPIFRGLSIGCERCHGPGELHVARHEQGIDLQGKLDDTIVNPLDLEPTLREAVCQQCHLGGEMRIARRGRDLYDFRPGMPWHTIAAVFVDRDQSATRGKITGHVEQMHASRCFLESKGKMGCTTCHEVHAPNQARQAESYRSRCLTCHTDRSCTQPLPLRQATEPPDHCIECHMPALGTEVSHAAITDHRIRRLSKSITADAVATRPALKLFHDEEINAGDPESLRDWAVATVRWGDRDESQFSPEQIAGLVSLLQAATAREPGDLDAQEALGHALWWQKQFDASLRAFEAVLDRSPQREFSLYSLASRLQQLRRYESATGYWKRAISVNPWVQRTYQGLALTLAEQRDWTGAAEVISKALELFPGDLRSRQLLVECYLGQSQFDRAEAEFEQLMLLEPPQPARLRLWFENHPARKATQ